MKITLIIKRLVQSALLGAIVVSTASLAQPGPGAGWGGGYGRGYGMGPGAGGCPRAQTGDGFVRGWELMSPVERSEQQGKMRAAKSYDECIAVYTENRGKLEIRAKEKGLTLVSPPFNPCDRMKARGFIQ